MSGPRLLSLARVRFALCVPCMCTPLPHPMTDDDAIRSGPGTDGHGQVVERTGTPGDTGGGRGMLAYDMGEHGQRDGGEDGRSRGHERRADEFGCGVGA